MTTRDALKARHYPFVAQAAENGWHIYFPDLPGCQTYAESWDEVSANARAVFEAWVDLYVDEGRKLPEPTLGGPVLPWEIEHFTGDAGRTTAEVADELGVSVRRVQALARQRGVGTKHGRDLLFTKEDVEAMRHRVPGRPPATEPVG